MKVMLAEDEFSMINIVKHIVTDMNCEFVYATNGKDAVDLFFKEMPDLAILDVMMPKLDGFDVCSIIRQKSDTPVMFLTSKSDIVDKSIGFKMGADDYLVKPFHTKELELRIQALLKRSGYHERSEDTRTVFTYNDLTVDYDQFEVYLRGEKVEMTLKEFSIIALLSKYPGQVFTRGQLIDSVWGRDYIGDYNTLTVFIRKIREKIEDNPAQPQYLQTVWGIGYKFASNDCKNQKVEN